MAPFSGAGIAGQPGRRPGAAAGSQTAPGNGQGRAARPSQLEAPAAGADLTATARRLLLRRQVTRARTAIATNNAPAKAVRRLSARGGSARSEAARRLVLGWSGGADGWWRERSARNEPAHRDHDW